MEPSLHEAEQPQKPGQRRTERKEERGATGNHCAGTAPSWGASRASKTRQEPGTICCESKGRQEERHWAETEHGEGG